MGIWDNLGAAESGCWSLESIGRFPLLKTKLGAEKELRRDRSLALDSTALRWFSDLNAPHAPMPPCPHWWGSHHGHVDWYCGKPNAINLPQMGIYKPFLVNLGMVYGIGTDLKHISLGPLWSTMVHHGPFQVSKGAARSSWQGPSPAASPTGYQGEFCLGNVWGGRVLQFCCSLSISNIHQHSPTSININIH